MLGACADNVPAKVSVVLLDGDVEELLNRLHPLPRKAAARTIATAAETRAQRPRWNKIN